MDNVFYVYTHSKPNGEIFYVGKGKNKRAWSHHTRNSYWKNIVAKYGCSVNIIDNNLSEKQAFELEEFVISICERKLKGGALVNMSDGGEGQTGYSHTDETKQVIAQHSRGSNNPNADDKVYTFINYHTEEEYTGTRLNFKLDKKVESINIFHNMTFTRCGWYLKGTDLRGKAPLFDPTIYSFTHTDGTVIVATRFDFKKQTGVTTKPLFIKPPKRVKVTYGWCLTDSIGVPTLSPQYKFELFYFQNEDGRILHLTKHGFQVKTGVNPSQFFKSTKHHNNCDTKGWSLKVD